jgi:Fe-S-cluster containining protein
MSVITQEGFNYQFNTSACASCGAHCCSGESGYIRISQNEMVAIANFLKMDVETFMQIYLYKDGFKWAIKERKRDDLYDCAFLDYKSGNCLIYSVRPNQCRTFPFWDYYKEKIDELKVECPGVSEK